MKRIYFLAPNIKIAKKVVHDLLLALVEERNVSAREALANVIAHIDAEIVELHRLREAVTHHP